MLTGEFRWAYPAAFLLILFIPLAFYLLNLKKRKSLGIKFPAFKTAETLSRDYHQWLKHIPIIVRLCVLLLLVTVLARPQGIAQSVRKQVESLDIMLVLDLSESMRAYDIKPNRLAVAKQVLERFIKKRSNDHLGLVVFSGTPLTLSPLTIDHASILEQLGTVHTNTVGVEGTAMGEALLMAVNRLLDFRENGIGQSTANNNNNNKARRQIIILATDGVNNRGAQPLLAAKIIREKKIKLYTVGLGGEKRVLRYERDYHGNRIPLYDVYGRAQYWDRPNEKALGKLASQGDGQYFNAHSQEAFDRIMDEIDGLEKNLVSLNREYIFNDQYFWVLLLALSMLMIEMILRVVRFQSVL